MAISEESHPTRDEWEARQALLPSAARTTMHQIAAVRAEEAAARQLDYERDVSHRLEFEAAVSAALTAAGATWLAACREPDREVKGLPTFTRHTQTFAAVFDASTMGVWPIFLWLTNPSGGWTVHEWIALRPDAATVCGSYTAALAASSTYCRAPF